MKKFIVPLITVAVVVSVIIGGCVPEAAPPVTPPPVTPPPVTPPPVTPPVEPPVEPEEWAWVVVDEWKIPVLSSVTGGFAFIGEDINRCYTWSQEQINAAGGIAGKPLVFEFHDDECDPGRGAAEISKVVGWALTTLGPFCSPACGGAGPIGIDAGLYMLWDSTGVDICKEFQPWVLSTQPESDTVWPAGVRAWLKQNPDITKVCPIYTSEGPVYKGMIESAMEGVKQAGLEVTDYIAFSEEIVDFGPPAVKALATGADGFFICGNPPAVAPVFMEMRKRGMDDNTKYCMSDHQDTPGWWEIAEGNMEGFYCVDPYNTESKNPRWQAFCQWKKEGWDLEGYGWNIGMVDEVFMIKACFEDCKITGDPAKLKEERLLIRDWFNNVDDFPGVTGPFDIVDGIIICDPYLRQSDDYKFHTLGQCDPEGNLLPAPD